MRDRSPPRLLLATLLLTLTLTACSTSDLVHIASSGDPSKALSSLANYKAKSYTTNPLRLVGDIKQTQRNYRKLLGLLRGEVGARWGSHEVLTPSNKRYVKYTQNYKSRAIIQFDHGTILVETLDQENPRQSLHSAIVTTLLTPEDPRAVDLYSDKQIALSGRPYLLNLVEDQRQRAIDSPQRAEAYATDLLSNAYSQRRVTTPEGEQQVHSVTFRMVNDFENRQAKQIEPLVAEFARRYRVSKSLVFAIIKTESAFNPYAVSTAPAYGLMQLVPSSGGRDAYALVKGRPGVPSSDYLFNPRNNIELGTAYLHILDSRYLAAIEQPLSREYATISAYNGGAGNVLNTFSKDHQQALARINALSPAEVYQRLKLTHPRDETRRYLVKVLDARRTFATL